MACVTSLDKHLDTMLKMEYYADIVHLFDELLDDPILYRFPADVLDLITYIVLNKQQTGLEITCHASPASTYLTITADDWWVYDLELLPGRKIQCKLHDCEPTVRAVKVVNPANLKLHFGKVFDEDPADYCKSLVSPLLKELLKDAKSIYLHKRKQLLG